MSLPPGPLQPHPSDPTEPAHAADPTEPAHSSDPARRADPAGDRGVLFVRGPADRARRWARGGFVGAHVVPLDGWTAVCPWTPVAVPVPARREPGFEPGGAPSRLRARRSARAGRPAELEVFAGRPVPAGLRPAVGLYLFGLRAVVTAQEKGRRSVPHWLVWQPGDALVAARPLPQGRLADLARAAGLPPGPGDPRLAQVLLDPTGSASDVLAGVVAALGLPGGGLVDGSLAPAAAPGAVEVEPSPRTLARFRATAHEDAQLRAELER